MSDFFRVLITRIFAGGIICTLAMMLTGEGAKKEIVRLGCACLMVILVFTPFRGVSLNTEWLRKSGADISDYVKEGMEKAEQERFESAARNIEAHIVRRAAAEGVECRADVKYHITNEKRFVIDEIRISCGGKSDKREALQKAIEEDCGVSGNQIIWIKEQE